MHECKMGRYSHNSVWAGTEILGYRYPTFGAGAAQLPPEPDR